MQVLRIALVGAAKAGLDEVAHTNVDEAMVFAARLNQDRNGQIEFVGTEEIMEDAISSTVSRDAAESTITEIFEQHYRDDVVSCQSLGGEFDRTYVLRAAPATKYVVKLFASEVESENPHWQHHLLEIVFDHPGIIAPRVIRDRDGADLLAVSVSGKPCEMAVYSWVPGRILADIDEHDEDLLFGWGALAGNLVTALRDVEPDRSVTTVHPWDVLAAPGLLQPLLSAVTEPSQRALVENAIELFHREVAPRIDELPKSVVHQDLNDFNVLARITPTGEQQICGVIDFADALYTARVAEVAIAGAYAMLRKTDPIPALLAVARGFRSITDMSDAETAVLYPLAVARLALNAATWTARAGGLADDYGRARSRYTWTALSALSQVPAKSVESLIKGECSR